MNVYLSLIVLRWHDLQYNADILQILWKAYAQGKTAWIYTYRMDARRLKKIALRPPAVETEQGEKSCGAICATGNIFSPMCRKIADVRKKR